jgi:hypothetical protein
MLDKLFGFAKPSINSLSFDTAGWVFKEGNSEKRSWVHSNGNAVLFLYFFDMSPDLPSLSEGALGRFYKAQAGADSAVLKLDVQESTRLKIIELLIRKKWGRGLLYSGSFTIPFRDFSFLIKVESAETSNTGLREALILDECISSGLVKVRDNGEPEGWTLDPFPGNGGDEKTLSTNLSELEEYDERFPGHPLTLVRKGMKQVRRTLKATAEVLNAPRSEE